MPRRKKFTDGGRFLSDWDLVSWILAGGWVYWKGRPKHPGWMRSQQLHTLVLHRTKLSRAVPNYDPEDPDDIPF